MRSGTVIATHTNTDFDAFGSLLAAGRLYPAAVVAVPASLNRNVRDFYRLYADELDLTEAARVEVGAIRCLVVVETVSAARLAELEHVALDPAVEKVVFDHHAAALPDWADPATSVISDDGALTTTLVGILADREIVVTPVEATAFALGIHEDTGSLTYPTTTQRDVDALAWCIRHGARQELLGTFLHTPLTAAERALLNGLMEATETHTAGGIDVLVAAVEWPEYVDGVSNLAHKVVDLTDCRALVVLVEMEGRVLAVTRSRTPELDAGEIAAALGGGGHAPAASAVFKGSLAEARERVLGALPQAVRAPLRAADVMSRPARTVTPQETVAKAMVACQRHGVSGILVADRGHLVGAVRREDLDRAVGHGLSNAPVKAIMSGRVPTADEDATLGELQRLLTGSETGRVAILHGDELAGVVTRRDLLSSLGGWEEESATPVQTLAEELGAVDRLARAFEAIAAASEPYDGVYLVGGTIRDILLGEEGFDVDIAVEGDAIELACRIADELGGRVRPHEKFGTAVVLYGDGERIDVVTARTEFYDAPAALPSVEHATIREDLFRRDFTINAMAASLKGGDFGRLVDPFGGMRDLSEHRVRVLHNLSFIEDPTRIFRAIRYENRYAFRMDEHTVRLARGCIEMGLVGDLSSSRLRDELIALLEEREVAHTILRLAELGADRAIHPNLAADDDAVRLADRLRELKSELHAEAPDWRLRLAVLARRLAPDEVYDWLARLDVRRRDAEQIASAVTVAPRLVERLVESRPDPAEVVALADPYAPDAPLLALAVREIPALREYFTRLRDVRLAITGRDLADLGLAESPRVGEVLAELRRRKLRGHLDGRESELAAARELIDG